MYDYEVLYHRELAFMRSLPLDLSTQERKNYYEVGIHNGVPHQEMVDYVAGSATNFILALGGRGVLSSMINAREFILLPEERGGIKFKFSGTPEYNTIEILNNAMDYIDVTISKVHNGKIVRKHKQEDIFIGDLKRTIEQMIQLYLSL